VRPLPVTVIGNASTTCGGITEYARVQHSPGVPPWHGRAGGPAKTTSTSGLSDAAHRPPPCAGGRCQWGMVRMGLTTAPL